MTVYEWTKFLEFGPRFLVTFKTEPNHTSGAQWTHASRSSMHPVHIRSSAPHFKAAGTLDFCNGTF
ncbi:hypothetical protein AGABI1DRAFT_113423 [Agaricus bisporus var. burnettii JB137-S8]|uniref:Uncharacterized protein n=1 Tax=Agaricus bisporus var. burnettii (strain JB137-S8 / ATCC MYA-4627 / FGSC 10392) TaxID=597362 RepID=K5WXK9_AGABU|nr:uncharacterized protein AGABI1DRAFT_113423 [Agaricus bisporus var. burnettii JB137-S8]EKM80221.1 hypothetical protein AGABI1DRAFT_113423 [Agaricus bisporus var. burnettii JB137-S8]